MFIASFYNYTFITTNYTEATVYIKYYGQCKSKLISLFTTGLHYLQGRQSLRSDLRCTTGMFTHRIS